MSSDRDNYRMVRARAAANLGTDYDNMSDTELVLQKDEISDGIRALQSTDDPALNEEAIPLEASLWKNSRAIDAEFKRRWAL